MSIESYKKEFEKEGFKHIYQWTDEPNTKYAIHKHKDKVSFYVVGGSLILNVRGREIKLKSGDRFDLTPNEDHSAQVGPDGCNYIVGEMIEGDS